MNTTVPGACWWCFSPRKVQNASGISVEKAEAGWLAACRPGSCWLTSCSIQNSCAHFATGLFFFLLVWFSCSEISVCEEWGWSCVRGVRWRVFPSCGHCSRFLSRSFTAVVSQLWCCSWIAVSWQCRLQRKAFYLIFLCNAALDLNSVFAMIEKCLLGSRNLCGNI